MLLDIVILAAGLGKRMHSKKPKVLHKLAGKTMLERVVDTATRLNPNAIHVVVGHHSEMIQDELSHLKVNWVKQDMQLGTGHAVLQTLPHLSENSHVLILSADVPLIQLETLHGLIASTIGSTVTDLGLLVACVDDPYGFGRVVRDGAERIHAIVEEKDASANQKKIDEIYSGICLAHREALNRWLPKLSNQNAQEEYYLTEIIAMASNEGVEIASMEASDPLEILGVNDRKQLQMLERAFQKRLAEQLLIQGVHVVDAARIDIRGILECGLDVCIDVNSVFEGSVSIGEGSVIGPNCVLKNVKIGEHCQVLANSVLENCQIGDHCQIGPFARIRPGTILASNCKIGNFVEVKNAVFDEGSKANHLSYLGDVTIGKHVNIGAGTITCNYDGANKYQTVIEDGAFIGSDTQLVAPVTVGKDATIGAGSTIRKDAPPGELTLTENRQKTISGWKRPVKES
ncbi:bifunctional UDP-N-acetylglucosamine diphosphorylase/glucosamine-1-phosphate N-acetyltransferase GlmU [Legionella impletisoli]|uniref:Bifunctional protein GlmU n=1 Tax=Legionella impletisoli TaxID=343510 RepID=A0A917NCC7_9GAMM|nr:bifunctional UDP-N-acetylglucosamine diphosphorylase/glucosamine-1-phosphate N-acetyltransferase GlmU [Legionella impletisoli]GGI86846.1 bifunctional protein GlmU [Legionella impletisoli]